MTKIIDVTPDENSKNHTQELAKIAEGINAGIKKFLEELATGTIGACDSIMNFDHTLPFRELKESFRMAFPVISTLTGADENDLVVHDIKIPPGCAVIIDSDHLLIIDPKKAGKNVIP